MTWEIFPVTHGLGQWHGVWDDLNRRLYGGHPLHDARFVQALLRHFGTGQERLCVHHAGAQPDGILIMYRRRAGIWTQFVPAHTQSAPVLIERAEILYDLFAQLPNRAIVLEFMCQDPEFAPKSFLCSDGKANLAVNHALTMNVDLSGTFQEYWEKRPRNLVKNIRRYHHRVARECRSAEIRRITSAPSMHEAVARYGILETSGWKGRQGTSVHIGNRQGRFYAEIMAGFAETGQSEVVEYWLNHRLAASRLILRGAGMNIILKTSYDEELAQFAPGRLLLYGWLEQAFAEAGNAVVEFYTDATRDQLAWATGQRHIQHVMIFRNHALARMYDAYKCMRSTLGLGM